MSRVKKLLGDGVELQIDDTLEGLRGVPGALITALREAPAVVCSTIVDLVRNPLSTLLGHDRSDASSPRDSRE